MTDDPSNPTQQPQLGFAEDIKPLFRESDRNAMRGAFDLWSYADVTAHATKIAGAVKLGKMPCDGPWPAAKVELFERWLEQGAAR